MLVVSLGIRVDGDIYDQNTAVTSAHFTSLRTVYSVTAGACQVRSALKKSRNARVRFKMPLESSTSSYQSSLLSTSINQKPSSGDHSSPVRIT